MNTTKRDQNQTEAGDRVGSSELLAIGERLRTQDNRCTMNPMFCVQILVRDKGYDSAYSDNKCWWNPERMECVYEEPDDLKGWEEYGYKDRWETVMVAFTEEGCKQYLELNGHNDRRRAHNGEVQIYVESFNRCPEMIAIREALMANKDYAFQIARNLNAYDKAHAKKTDRSPIQKRGRTG